MKKILALLIVVIGIALLLNFEPQEVRLAFIADLSGRRSQLGVAARNGVQLAVDEVNNRGGINGAKVKLTIFDNIGKPEVCAKVLKEITAAKFPFVIGPLTSNMATTVLAEIKGKNILLGSPTMSADSIKGLDDNFIRFISSASLHADGLSREIIAQEIKSVAILYDSSNAAYAKPIYLRLKHLLEKEGIIISYVSAMQESETTSTLAEGVLASKAQAVVCITSGIDAAAICQQVYKTNSGILRFGAYWTRTGDVISLGGKAVEGMIFPSPYQPDTPSEKYADFENRYLAKFKIKPGFSSQYAYETAQITFEGMRISKSFEPAKVKASIIAKADFVGLMDNIHIDKFGDAHRRMSLLIIKDGEFKLLK